MLTRGRAVVLAVAALSLGACSNVHPGSAAVVGRETISMRTLDDTAEAYCALTVDAARQQGVESVDNAQVRRQAIVGLVSVIVARDIAETENLDVDRSAYELTAEQRDRIDEAFPASKTDELAQAIQDSQEVSAIAIALGTKLTGRADTPETTKQLADVGQAAILKTFRAKDVKFAPRFGLDPGANVRSDTGSISVTPVDLEAPTAEELPAALRCS